MPVLTAEQIQSFKDHGYLIVPGLIEPAYIDAWRRCFWDHLGGTPDDPESWRNKPFEAEGFKIQPEHAMFNRHPKMQAIVSQLGGGNFIGGDQGAPLIHWPSKRDVWSPTRWGHVDAYPPAFWWPFMLAATTYAYDVEPMGGGFQYWPDSHHTTHQHFLKHPHMIDGQFSREPGFEWSEENDFTNIAPLPPREFTGTAGDVIFWHSFLVHTGSANIRQSPRLGVFSRWQHRDQDAIKYEVPANLWKYWAV